MFRKIKILPAGILAWSLLAPVPAGRAADAPIAEPERPTLRLAADRSVGMSPLEVRIRGSLRGPGRPDINFCHPGVTWQVWSLSRHEVLRSSQDPKCHHDRDAVAIPLAFSHTFTLGPGIHMCRLTVRGSDGTTLRSNMVRIRVF